MSAIEVDEFLGRGSEWETSKVIESNKVTERIERIKVSKLLNF